jgi:5-hydroxyisourate hydrolase
VSLALHRQDGASWTPCSAGSTDVDGRWRPADGAGSPLELDTGTYRLDFGSGAYFAATGQTGFYPQVSVTFEVTDPAAHYHVPLLLSPFAYSTYRGS